MADAQTAASSSRIVQLVTLQTAFSASKTASGCPTPLSSMGHHNQQSRTKGQANAPTIPVTWAIVRTMTTYSAKWPVTL